MTIRIQGKGPGEFIARPRSRASVFDNGVLNESAAHLRDGALLSYADDKTLIEWDSTRPLAGILLEPDRDEMNSGRRRVVFAMQRLTVIRNKLSIPEGLDAAATAEFDRLGILFRPESLPV